MGADWLKVLETRGNTAVLAFIAAALVSLGSALHLASLGALPEWAAALSNVLTILFGVLSLPWLFSLVTKPLKQYRSRASRTKAIRRQISALLLEEASVFWGMVARQQRNTYANLSTWDGSVGHRGLVNRNLLHILANVGDGSSLWMPDEVWDIVGNDQKLAQEIVAKTSSPRR